MDEKVLRGYQKKAAVQCFQDAMQKGVHPLVVTPTGSGKSLICCEIINLILSHDPTWNILVMSHTEEICEQDFIALTDYFSGVEIGLYHAGLHSRTINKITVAGIQSACRSPELFEDFDFIIIDEAHSVPTTGEGQYRTFLKPFEKYIGLTATHYRLGHGYIHKGEGAIFNKISIDLSQGEEFTKLQDEGYISKIYSKKTLLELDANDIRTRLGDFVVPDMSKKFNREAITTQAVKEICEIGKNYYQWLVFAIDIEHAESIKAELIKQGINAEAVHSKMEGNRKQIIKRYKNQQIQCLVNVDILTIGFDAPNIDLIAMLRPTQSPVLHVQSIGRGLRVAKNKDHCLVLDFAQNTSRLGPINAIQVVNKDKSKGGGGALTKPCPECQCLNPIQARICMACEHEFIFEKGRDLQNTAGSGEIVANKKKKPWEKDDDRKWEAEEKQAWQEVRGVQYAVWNKPDKPVSVIVIYKCKGGQQFREWVLLHHKGWAGNNAIRWCERRWKGAPNPVPRTVLDFLKNSNRFKIPVSIKVDFSNKFNRIVDHRFPPA